MWGVFFGGGGGGEEEEVGLKTAPLIFNKRVRKNIPDLLFRRIHLHAKHSVALVIVWRLICVCVRTHRCPNGPKCPA